MKILFPADGSKFSKKALAFLVTHEALSGEGTEIVVLNVQPPVPPRVRSMVGADDVEGYHREEAEKVLRPIERFLQRQGVTFRTTWVVGNVAKEVVKAIKKEKAHMVIMGTHGHGLIGRALMGSVAQNVVTECDIPVLLVK